MRAVKADFKTENILRINGIYAQGYGSIAKLVMRDKRLTVEAKGIYSYIASFAGSGTTAFPSVYTITTELNISETRFYKHRQLLIDLNYITVTRERVNNLFARNIYELVMNPEPLPQKQAEQAQQVEQVGQVQQVEQVGLARQVFLKFLPLLSLVKAKWSVLSNKPTSERIKRHTERGSDKNVAMSGLMR